MVQAADLHESIKKELMGDGSPHGIKDSQTKKQHYMQ